MATRKIGPPVPPRPNAKPSIITPRQMTPTSGRTTIYKSSAGPGAAVISSPTTTGSTQVKTRPVPPVPRPRHKSPVRATPSPSSLTIAKQSNLLHAVESLSSSTQMETHSFSSSSTKSSTTTTTSTSTNVVSHRNGDNDRLAMSQSDESQDKIRTIQQQSDQRTGVEPAPSKNMDFTSKILSEMEVIMSKNYMGLSRLPRRQESEDKEISPPHKSVEEKICESKTAFSKKLLSELAAIRNPDNAITTLMKKDETTVSVDVEQSVIVKRRQKKSNNPSPRSTSSKIRTSDWIEVEDNGKEVLMTSCHISLEDSGLEDEEKTDEASSGVGDSWDSVKDYEER